MPERIKVRPREIKFAGENKAGEISRGFAFTTLRHPRADYAFVRGEIVMADCFDSGDYIPLVVLSNETKALKDFSIPQLALDGCFSPAMARNMLKEIPGYEKTNRRTKLQAITVVSKDSFDKLPDETKKYILGRTRKFDQLVKRPEPRHLFFPTMARYLSRYGGVWDWTDFLEVHKLVSLKDIKKMKAYEQGGLNIFRILKDHHGIFENLTIDNREQTTIFRPMILGLFD